MYTHLLVPTDGSELSDLAVDNAIRLATALGARLTAWAGAEVYAMTYAEGAFVDQAAFREQALAGAKRRVQAVVERARAAGVPCEGVAEDCEAVWRGIVDAAAREGCDLVLMASHGRKGLSAVLLGSETQKVLTHSKVPVLVYR
ncbi:universal stress protein [Dokdonella sp. MW10]|uniref:universal stress protein n=1 Tax=Dokdonella sp. MW10 TaxID=2992926 RepID=UPI003F800D28